MTAVTRSTLLERRTERTAMAEGFQLLDDKRLLLAGELLREIACYTQLWRAFAIDCVRAGAALREALERAGLQGLQCHPVDRGVAARLALRERRLFGVRVQEAELHWRYDAAPAAEQFLPEAERCREELRALVAQAAVLAALAGSLRRLGAEYRRTERRARALEDVLIPEADASLRAIEEWLDEGEREEGSCTHLASRRAAPA